jgi:hypothetical protein
MFDVDQNRDIYATRGRGRGDLRDWRRSVSVALGDGVDDVTELFSGSHMLVVRFRGPRGELPVISSSKHGILRDVSCRDVDTNAVEEMAECKSNVCVSLPL